MHVMWRSANGVDERAVRDSPQADRIVITPAGNESPVWTEGNSNNSLSRTSESLRRRRTINGPQFDVVIETPADEQFAVRTEGDGPDIQAMADERAHSRAVG